MYKHRRARTYETSLCRTRQQQWANVKSKSWNAFASKFQGLVETAILLVNHANGHLKRDRKREKTKTLMNKICF